MKIGFDLGGVPVSWDKHHRVPQKDGWFFRFEVGYDTYANRPGKGFSFALCLFKLLEEPIGYVSYAGTKHKGFIIIKQWPIETNLY